MSAINTNLSSLLMQLNQTSFANNLGSVGHQFKSDGLKMPGNDFAFMYAPDMAGMMANYDLSMDSFANFQDLIMTAKDGVAAMRNEGESLRSLITQAKEGNLSDELLGKIQEEVNSRIAKITDIKNNCEFNGINPLAEAFSLNVPGWQDMFGVSEVEESEEAGEMQNVLASISFDMTIDGDSGNKSFSIGASATINIGINDDGSLQIDVDATMDFDLSGLNSKENDADKMLEMLNDFINLLTGKENDLNTASNIIDSLFAKATASIEGDNFSIFADNNVSLEKGTSEAIKGQIVQHASIVLDGNANQLPNIAINIL